MKKKKTCKEKNYYFSAADAERDRVALAADLKRAGDKSWKRLVVYPCRECGRLHVGHLRRSFNRPAPEPKPAPKERLMTFGQAIRKLKRLDAEYERMQDHFNRKRAEFIGKLIAADRAAGFID